jgi:hypothetical protein
VVLVIAGFLGQEVIDAPTVVEQVNAPQRDAFEARDREW